MLVMLAAVPVRFRSTAPDNDPAEGVSPRTSSRAGRASTNYKGNSHDHLRSPTRDRPQENSTSC